MKYICINNRFLYYFKKSIHIIAVFVISLLLTSCDFEESLADVVVIDAIRHYYAVVQGQKLNIVVKLENKSDFPFKITDIQTSCGCIILKEGILDIVPAQSTGILELTYDSNKNIGLVNHFIYIYGNLKKTDKLICDFDLHVVPDALYTPDYEELYRKQVEAEGGVKNMVEGNENEKGYYLSAGDNEGENNHTDLKY
jgi:LEA14-like dessication related protein